MKSKMLDKSPIQAKSQNTTTCTYSLDARIGYNSESAVQKFAAILQFWHVFADLQGNSHLLGKFGKDPGCNGDHLHRGYPEQKEHTSCCQSFPR